MYICHHPCQPGELAFFNLWNIEVYNPAIPLLDMHPKELERGVETSTCVQIFTAAWFTAAIGGNNPSVHWWMVDKHNVVHPYTGIWFSLNKEGDSGTCYNVDEPWGHDAQWNKPDTEGQILSDSIHKRSLEELDPQRQKVDGGGQGLGSQCLKGTELQFGKMRKFWRWMAGMVARQCECA